MNKVIEIGFEAGEETYRNIRNVNESVEVDDTAENVDDETQNLLETNEENTVEPDGIDGRREVTNHLSDVVDVPLKTNDSRDGIDDDDKANDEDYNGESATPETKLTGEVYNTEIEIDDKTSKYLIYGINDNPPLHVTIVCALQQGLLSLSGQLVVSLLVADAVCASNNDMIKAKLMSSTLFMSGVTTVFMNLFGIRLPLFQGAASEYVIPLLLVGNVDGSFCSYDDAAAATAAGSDSLGIPFLSNDTAGYNMTAEDVALERAYSNIRRLQGGLILAGIIHALLGMFGIVGLLVKFIGPLTIVPTMVLIFIFVVSPSLKFVEAHWGIACSTIGVAVILFLYLSKYNMPVPVWTPSLGFRIIRYPLHQVFAILISIIVNWALCAVLTTLGLFTDDRSSMEYNSRTDARTQIIYDNPWFTFPYPGQYGMPGFSSAAFLACLIATMISVLDSIGDYYACARVCRVPAPPKHAVNRGIMIEGMCSILSGAVGCGHATSTYGGNIGGIGVTKVASRPVFIGVGILYILFGVFGKFSALFITIPYPVLGGAIVVMFGIFFGVVISNLEVTNMSSSRNLAILGLATFFGLCVPTWVERQEKPINTGHEQFDQIAAMLLGNPNLVGTILAFVLDNTVPGTKEDRGIAAWQVSEEDETKPIDKTRYNEGYEVYSPLLPEIFMNSRLLKYIPFFPYRRTPSIERNVI